MDFFLFFLYIISLVIMADSKLKEFPAGRKFLNEVENGTVSILRWRAESQIENDMKGINKFLPTLTFIIFLAIFVTVANDKEPNSYLVLILFMNILLIGGIDWFLDAKKETIKIIVLCLFVTGLPWVLFFLGVDVPTIVEEVFRGKFYSYECLQDVELKGLEGISDYDRLFIISWILFWGSSFLFGYMIFLYAVLSIGLSWVLILVNKTSFYLFKLEKQKLQLFFVAINILVPVWFFIKGQFLY